MVEHLGADTFVHGHFGAARTGLTVRLGGVGNMKPGDVVPLSVDPRHLHMFDPESGARLPAA